MNPPIVFLDQIMPGLSGMELAERIRALGALSTKNVLVTSGVITRARFPTNGPLDAAIEKPIRRSDLLECLGRLLAADDPLAPAGVPASRAYPVTPGAQLAALSLLVAEDNLVNQQVVRGMLTRAGHTVHIVGNGADAVEAVRELEFDAVLMDMQMPVLDGIGATRGIRALPAPKGRIPIIALTADAMTGAKEYYIEAGMDDYLSKPIRVQALMEKLAVLVRRDIFSPVEGCESG